MLESVSVRLMDGYTGIVDGVAQNGMRSMASAVPRLVTGRVSLVTPQQASFVTPLHDSSGSLPFALLTPFVDSATCIGASVGPIDDEFMHVSLMAEDAVLSPVSRPMTSCTTRFIEACVCTLVSSGWFMLDRPSSGVVAIVCGDGVPACLSRDVNLCG